MSLHIYLDKKEFDGSVINFNDMFFDMYTELEDSSAVRNILLNIDNASRTSNLTFTPRTRAIGNLNKNFLSTGSKTLLNIILHPDKCFNTIECGDNVLRELIKLSVGNAVVSDLDFYYENSDCDIIWNNKHYSDFDLLLRDINKSQ